MKPNWIDLEKWKWLKTIILLEREVLFQWKYSKEISYYISSLDKDYWAKKFLKWIRDHWAIEVFHYVKDVIFGEDKFKIKNKNTSILYSIFRNIAINIFSKNNISNFKASLERLANKPKLIINLF